MTNTIKVICEDLLSEVEVEMGSSLASLAERIPMGRHPVLAAQVNNHTKELNYKIYTPITIRFLDITSFEGIRVYQRSACFILQKATSDLFPNKTLHIRHSMGQDGFYCEIDEIDAFDQPQADALRRRMQEIVAANLPFVREKALTSDVRARYAARGYTDKIALLDTRPRLYSDIYTLDDAAGYFYGSLTASTGLITNFDIQPFHKGFFLALPLRTAPDTLSPPISHNKMFDIFREYQSWVGLMTVPTVGSVNAQVINGVTNGLVMVAEAFHERKFAKIADKIREANHERGIRIAMISGPSSSGKTTSAKRLAVQLGVLGLHPVLISLDDYFVDREKTPLDANGGYDYEALEAIDIALFNDHLHRLLAGESVEIPRYDFITGRRAWHKEPLTLNQRSLLIIEGIHGLNPRLTPQIPEEQKFKIYVSCFTSVAMDNLSRISTTDNRLLRRLTRDYRQRGADAVSTLSRWGSVRRGEEQHIFPYQDNADVMLNSSLFYEISVLRPFAEKILREVPDTVPEYDEARRMLKFLDNFIPIPPDAIPPNSILREFIGGSIFKY